MDQLAALGPAHDEGHRLMAAVTDWSARTPCADWDVAALVRHQVAGNRIFAARLAGESADPEVIDTELRAEGPTRLPDLFAETGLALESAFAAPGALDREITLGIGPVPGPVALHLRLVETFVHGWDLGRATGLRPAFDEAVVEEQIARAQALLERIPLDRSPFAPPVAVAADVGPLDRLVALLGRDPA